MSDTTTQAPIAATVGIPTGAAAVAAATSTAATTATAGVSTGAAVGVPDCAGGYCDGRNGERELYADRAGLRRLGDLCAECAVEQCDVSHGDV